MSIDYTLRFDDEGDAIACYCCQYPAPLSEFRPRPRGGTLLSVELEDDLLCEFCSSSAASSTYSYPRQHEDRASAQSVAHAFNAIIDAIGADRSALWGGHKKGPSND